MNAFPRCLISLSLILSLNLKVLADEEAAVIESSTANYDGKQIVLSGDVVVETETGKVFANHVVLTPESTQKKMRFVHLKMNDDVKFQLKDGGQLLCSEADLDYLKQEGVFKGNQVQEYVIYTESCRALGDKCMPLVLKSLEMHVQLARMEGTSEAPKSCISEITANQKVTVNYNHDFIAAADHAVYQRLRDTLNAPDHKMPGHIHLFAESQNGMCQITNRNGDLIRANKILIDTLKRSLDFNEPRGTLSLKSKENVVEKVYFESDIMTWDDNLELLTFLGNITISQKAFGQLQGDREVRLYYLQENGKKKVRLIESLGETVVAYSDEDKKLIHTLTSYEKVTIDQVNLKTTAESPKDSNGRVVEGMQIYFHDIYGEIYADHAVLDYIQVNGKLNPEKLTLRGNVRILNRSSVNPEESEAFLQYALSDIVEFYPATNEMIMSSLSNGRVLFYDKANNLQISAPGVKIKRDLITKKESIQGIGDARFSLVDHELEKLKNHFSLEPARLSH